MMPNANVGKYLESCPECGGDLRAFEEGPDGWVLACQRPPGFTPGGLKACDYRRPLPPDMLLRAQGVPMLPGLEE